MKPIFGFPWFRKAGLFFYPASIPGWIIFIAAIVYLVNTFISIDSRSHSASDTLRPFIIILVLTLCMYTLVAYLTSRNKNTK